MTALPNARPTSAKSLTPPIDAGPTSCMRPTTTVSTSGALNGILGKYTHPYLPKLFPLKALATSPRPTIAPVPAASLTKMGPASLSKWVPREDNMETLLALAMLAMGDGKSPPQHTSSTTTMSSSSSSAPAAGSSSSSSSSKLSSLSFIVAHELSTNNNDAPIKEAGKWASKEAGKWASKEAGKWASKEAGKWASKWASKGANKEAGKEAGKGAIKEAGKGALPPMTLPSPMARKASRKSVPSSPRRRCKRRKLDVQKEEEEEQEHIATTPTMKKKELLKKDTHSDTYSDSVPDEDGDETDEDDEYLNRCLEAIIAKDTEDDSCKPFATRQQSDEEPHEGEPSKRRRGRPSKRAMEDGDHKHDPGLAARQALPGKIDFRDAPFAQQPITYQLLAEFFRAQRKGRKNLPAAVTQLTPEFGSNSAELASIGDDDHFLDDDDSDDGGLDKKVSLNVEQQVTLLRWLITGTHMHYPYPDKKSDLKQLCRQTKLNVRKVSNYFINTRQRLVKPFWLWMRQRTLSQTSSPSSGQPEDEDNDFPQLPVFHFVDAITSPPSTASPITSPPSITQTLTPPTAPTAPTAAN